MDLIVHYFVFVNHLLIVFFIFTVCAPGTYGSDCTLFCFCKSPTDRCTDGVCPNGCVPGYTGNSCNTSCYGASCEYECSDRKCSNLSSQCDVTTGGCNGGCQNGYKLPDCRENCDNGMNYGVNCSKLCSGRECFNKESSCDLFNGACDNNGCKKGYKGSDCIQGCQQSMKYGRNCGYQCNARNCLNSSSSCHVETGECVGGCMIGYKLHDCQQHCDNNINYGDQCLKKCSDRKCLRTSTCDYITGACYNQQCEAGYQGEDCYQVCDVDVNYGYSCSNICSERNCLIDRSSCDHITGKCEGGCNPGYREDDCIQKCNNGYYGDKCSKMCTERYCLSPSSCDHITGKCEGGCKNNKHGVDCILDCPVGFYGDGCTTLCSARKCKLQSDVCQTSDGSCAAGCLSGYAGFDCITRCSNGFYGDGCNQTCTSRKCKIFSDTCNHEDGSCGVDGCLPGYQLKDCSQQCTGRTYGLGCILNCDDRNCENDTICDIGIGKCEGSCKDGFELDDCTQKRIQAPPVTIIAGAVAAVVAAAIFAIILVVVFRRRKAAQHKSNEYTQPTDNLNDILYDVIVSNNDTGPIYENTTSVVSDQPVKTLAHKPKIPAKPKTASENISSVEPTVPASDNTNSVKPTVAASENTNSVKPTVAASENTNSVKPTVAVSENTSLVESTAPVPDTPSEDYYNLTSPTTKTDDIPIIDLKALVHKLKSVENTFSNMYKKLPSGFTAVYDDSQIKENKPKNRFIGYYPYDHNRVMLNRQDDDVYSDYINASYIDTNGQSEYFIAAQGATKVTINDFVRMIFEQKCDKIIMLTNLVESGKRKCEQYWPTMKETKLFGDLELTVVKESIRCSYVSTMIRMKHLKTGQTHQTLHLHYIGWLDHDVPEIGDLLDFLYRVNSYKPESTSPVIVHCSAGIGRTGSYIAIDALIREGTATGRIDIHLFIKTMRRQRKDMIQKAEQLQFVYEALVEAFEFGKTSVTVNEYEQLLKTSNTFSLTKHCRADELKFLNSLDNKGGRCKIFITNKPHLKIQSTPSWKKSIGYAVSDIHGHDMESIWTVITDQESSVAVVMLDNTSSISICPDTGTDTIVGPFTISYETEPSPDDDIRIHTVTTAAEWMTHVCKLILVNVSKETVLLPLKTVISKLVAQMDMYDKGEHPVTVLCSIKQHAALLCTVRNVIQRIKLDNEVEIFNTTRKILQPLHGSIKTMVEYDFVYDVVNEYVTSQNIYENL